MSASVDVIFYQVPQAEAAAALSIVGDYREGPAGTGSGLVLGRAYSRWRVEVGEGERIADALALEVASGWWWVHEEQDEDGAHLFYSYTPPLGMLRTLGEQDGPRFSRAEIQQWITEWLNPCETEDVDWHPDDLRALVDQKAGLAHRHAFGMALETSPAGSVVTPLPECAHCDDRVWDRSGHGWVHLATGARQCPPPPEQTYAEPAA